MFAVLFFVSILAYWFSIGCTEAWKWRMDARKKDDNGLVTYNSYHLWRVVNTASVFMSGMSLALMTNTLLLKALLSLVAMVAGWALYERTMSFVEKDSFLEMRGKAWHLAEDLYVKRFSVRAELFLFAAATASYVYLAVAL